MRKAVLITGLIFAFSSSIQSQSIIIDKEIRADRHFDKQSFLKAAKLYGELLQRDKVNESIRLKLARTYFYQQDFNRAYKQYSGIISKKYLVKSCDYLNYALILKSVMKQDSAEWWVRRYLEFNPRHQVAQDLLYDLAFASIRNNSFEEKNPVYGSQSVQDNTSSFNATLLVINSVDKLKTYVLSDKIIEVIGQNPNDPQWLNRLLDENNIEIVKTVYINPIYYRTGQTTLDEKSHNELKKLASLMKQYKFIEFELRAYHYGIGSDVDNLKISQSRVDAARDYLLNLDIQTERLLAIGIMNHNNGPGIEDKYHQMMEFKLVYLNRNQVVSN